MEKGGHEVGVMGSPASLGKATSYEGTGILQPLDPQIVGKLRRKMDLILLPTLAVMYTFNSLDRSNLGNARTAGLEKDLKMKGDQYNLLLTSYYIVFCLFGPVMAVFTRVATAKVALPCMMLAFGVASAATAATKNFEGLLACRIFVGIFESGFLASVVFYLSKWYTRAEIASRIAVFYAGTVVASAFGGLLAYGVFQITGGALHVWAYLFILEGCMTCLIAIAAYFILPGDIGDAYFLTPTEKKIATARMQMDATQVQAPNFIWSEALSEFRTIHAYARILIAVACGLLPQSSANFLAIMTVRLGYSVAKTNLYTVAPAVTATAFVLAFAYSSDHFRERGFHMAVPCAIGMIGYIILIAVHVETHKGIGYLAIFFCTTGAYPMAVIFSAWTVANIPNLNARALTTGILLSISNATGLVTSNIFLSREAPKYMTALIVNTTFSALGMGFVVSYSLYLRLLNRALATNDRPGGLFGEDKLDRGEGFRFQP
ncbi:uncharacterized protein A1O9_04669 [Exophiala aquamarina CBS 119918]|uniref:Major facilitator superfamily (MFS) profile domain-containing protein n=1 Tax=Exophiala aquamarina CBS 119918 TaxID=1182545 RepID=A0A072PIZ0_9EURO|nr:uncharacterized protein A1O9_04669 [Exophiala aquamarina CBS 119918]KEF59821.1 hypothetical protein A1O9_04669 [Exophiala aquamarina CBS 119918]